MKNHPIEGGIEGVLHHLEVFCTIVLHHLEVEGQSVCTQQKVFAQITSKMPTTLHFRLPNFDSGTSSEI